MLKNTVTTPIYYDDTVKFGIVFRPGSNALTTIARDSGRCTVSIDTRNDDYWVQSIEDGFLTEDSSDTTILNYSKDDDEDWEVYQEDDDSSNPYCEWDTAQYVTWFGTTEAESYQWLTPYQCTKISCTMMRKMNTGYPSEDLAFTINAQKAGAVTDTLDILVGESFLQFN